MPPTCTEEPRAELIHRQPQVPGLPVPPGAGSRPGSVHLRHGAAARSKCCRMPARHHRTQEMCAPAPAEPARPPARGSCPPSRNLSGAMRKNPPPVAPNSMTARKANTDRQEPDRRRRRNAAAETLPTPLAESVFGWSYGWEEVAGRRTPRSGVLDSAGSATCSSSASTRRSAARVVRRHATSISGLNRSDQQFPVDQPGACAGGWWAGRTNRREEKGVGRLSCGAGAAADRTGPTHARGVARRGSAAATA